MSKASGVQKILVNAVDGAMVMTKGVIHSRTKNWTMG